jgi:hypothetical protein
MNKLEIADLLKTEPRQWKISALRGENQSVRWLPIIDVSGKNFYLGLSEEGFWVADSRDKLIRLGKNGFFVPLLPILEQDYEEFLSHFKASLENRGLPVSIVSIFPWLETVICGLEQGSDYWAALALQWLESRKELQTVELEQVLKKVSKAKWASQKVRQRSKRLKFAISLDKKDKPLLKNAKKMPIIYNWHLVQFPTSECNAYSHSFWYSQDRVVNITTMSLKNNTIKSKQPKTVSFKSDRKIHVYNR